MVLKTKFLKTISFENDEVEKCLKTISFENDEIDVEKKGFCY
jgi:hypothetical protein